MWPPLPIVPLHRRLPNRAKLKGAIGLVRYRCRADMDPLLQLTIGTLQGMVPIVLLLKGMAMALLLWCID